MYTEPTDPDDFPWLAFFGALVIIAVVLAVALTSGMCTASTPC